MGEVYNYLFVELPVPQTREWALISSPFPLTLIILGYLYLVLYAGPHYMENRPPYKLKIFILLYNLIQILVNLWMIKEHLSFGWFSEYGVTCSRLPPSMPNSSNALKIFNCIWWLLLLKIFDLIETCVFVLRKKQNQVSILHVYHHASNIFYLWLYLTYYVDERLTLLTLINCAVHVIMYIYYFISAISLKYQQIISPVKHFITILQMGQFLVVIIFLLQAWDPACQMQFNLNVIIIFIGHLLIIFYLFYDFYKKSYTNVSQKKNN